MKIVKYIRRVKASRVILYIFTIAFVVFMAMPLIYLVSTAFKPMDELYAYPPRFFVRRPVLTNFSTLFGALSSSAVPFLRNLFNSLYTTTVSIVLTVLVCSMGAYGLCKLKPPGHSQLRRLVTNALMFSTVVTAIPTYTLMENLGLLNSYWSLILPKVAVAFNFFLMIQFIDSVPNTLLEAARIDGAGEWTIFWKIVLSCVKPAVCTLVVFAFTSSWNDYTSAMLYISREEMKTLPLAVQTISGGTGAANLSRAGAAGAAALLMTVPTIVVFTIMQARVLETMTYSGIKE